ncbi:hypothetical protein [Methylobacterium sp. ARG-1]|uniref:hypothetical protein n=1 Tax=Methylobacterium sp. ARG-1 TaxID=1692501 RepID=UPI0006800E28|nr:hypothetical protein [Methylobacterium sp. ARG-1]KNY22880.1 hypothetical protein AKJ13_10000 [Methylobacterium sp. ARG-1]
MSPMPVFLSIQVVRGRDKDELFMRPDRVSIRVLIIIAIAQIVGWGSVSLTSIVGARIAVDLGVDVAAVFAGNAFAAACIGAAMIALLVLARRRPSRLSELPVTGGG